MSVTAVIRTITMTACRRSFDLLMVRHGCAKSLPPEMNKNIREGERLASDAKAVERGIGDCCLRNRRRSRCTHSTPCVQLAAFGDCPTRRRSSGGSISEKVEHEVE